MPTKNDTPTIISVNDHDTECSLPADSLSPLRQTPVIIEGISDIESTFPINSAIQLTDHHQQYSFEPIKPTKVMEKKDDKPSDNEINVNKACPKQITPDIPTPFKEVLFWPSSKTDKTLIKKREKIPAVASSKEFIDYFKRKEAIKANIEKEKESRRKKREEKKTRPLI